MVNGLGIAHVQTVAVAFMMGMCWDDRISWELDGIGIDISNN